MGNSRCGTSTDAVFGAGHRLIDHQPDEFDIYLAERQIGGLLADDAVRVAVEKVRRDHLLE